MLLRTLRSLVSPSKRTGETRFSQAFEWFQTGRLDEAEAACIKLGKAFGPDADYLLGLIAERRGKSAEAASFFQAAVQGRTSEPTFHYSLGESLLRLSRFEEALVALQDFLQRAADTDPRKVRACLACAECTLQNGDAAGARVWRERAMAVAPEDPTTLVQVADALYSDSEDDEARALLARIGTTGAGPSTVRGAMMLPAVYASREHIARARERFERDMDTLLEAPLQPAAAPETQVGILPFYLAYHDRNNAALMAKVCAVMRKAYPAALSSNMRGNLHARPCSQRMKVGFVSTYFHSHSIGRTTIGFIRDLPRDRFQVFVFAIEPAEDPMARAIEACADRYLRLPNRLDSIRAAIDEAQLDALVFADIGMHPTTYFLALNRLAPLQVALWGHPVTTGIDTVDYFFTAAGIESETADSHYTERLVRPEGFFLAGYERPASTSRAADPRARESLGLPARFAADAKWYTCMQPAFKLHPDIDAAFAQILDADPRAVIVLLESRRSWRMQLERRFSQSLGKGLERVAFVPPMNHARFMAVLACADVVLDPLYFGGNNSSLEAFALGLPVVTLPGNCAGGRFTLASYREMGMEEAVVDSVERYASLAVRLANDADYRYALSRSILERCPDLFGRKDSTLALARFLDSAADRASWD